MTRLNTMKVILLGLICLLISANDVVKPGSKIFTRVHTMEVLKDKLLPLIPTVIHDIPLNTSKFSIPVKDWMTIDVFLTPTIKVVEIKPEKTNITFTTQSLNLTSAGVGFEVNAKLFINSTLFDSNGTIVINGSDNKANLTFNIVSGDHSVVVNTSAIDLSNIDFKITGDLIEDIIQTVWGSFKAQIISQMNTMISTTLKETLQSTLDSTLASLNGTFDVPGLPLGVFYNLTQLPTISTLHLELDVDNTFYNSKKKPARPPIDPPVDLPLFDPATQYDMQIFMSQYAVNSALYGLWDAGNLTGYVNSSVSPQYMKVSSFAALVPQLYTKYKEDDLVDLNVTVINSGPALIMAKDKSSLALKIPAVSIDMIVNQTQEKIMSKALTMVLSVEARITIWINTTNNSIQAKILDANVPSVNITFSNVGDIDAQGVRSVLELAMKVILPFVQKILDQTEFPLPIIEGFKLVDPKISFFDGYMAVESAVTAKQKYWTKLLNRLVDDLEGKKPENQKTKINEAKSIVEVKSFLRRD